MGEYLGVLAQVMAVLLVVFIIGQAAVLPVIDALSGVENHDVKDQQGNVVLDFETWTTDMQGVLFKILPALLMVGMPLIAVFWYIRFTQATGRR